VNAFHVCGGILAIWAVVVSFLGITREGFPGNKGLERGIELITVVLVVLAVSTGIVTAANEDHGEGRGEQPEASAALLI
jgi:hypothetical protein